MSPLPPLLSLATPPLPSSPLSPFTISLGSYDGDGNHYRQKNDDANKCLVTDTDSGVTGTVESIAARVTAVRIRDQNATVRRLHSDAA